MGYSNDGKVSTSGRRTGLMGIPPGFQIALVLLVLILGPVAAIKWLTQPSPPQPPAKISYPTGAIVVTGVQHMGKLQTISDTFQQIVKYEDNGGNWFTKLFNDPKKLFVVYGTVVAGVDLSTVTKGDVTIQRQDNTHVSIVLLLPAPQIFSSTLDQTKTQVYDISSGLFSPFNQGLDPNVENQVLAGAQGTLKTSACDANIMKQASDSAQVQLTSFLTALGFSSVIVTFAPGTCG
ncbi:MAG: DUF4230 domain-containing protein [Ktedonobacteraceae bacterium]|nr:DUF4230 domain-containing protein [Ktedonobacteraceae bacterium]